MHMSIKTQMPNIVSAEDFAIAMYQPSQPTLQQLALDFSFFVRDMCIKPAFRGLYLYKR